MGRCGQRADGMPRLEDPNNGTKAAFDKEVERTYDNVIKRADAPPDANQDRVQLVAEDSSQSISFKVPDGPPVLEGVETEDAEGVRLFDSDGTLLRGLNQRYRLR